MKTTYRVKFYYEFQGEKYTSVSNATSLADCETSLDALSLEFPGYTGGHIEELELFGGSLQWFKYE
jgi:hypothetical protein